MYANLFDDIARRLETDDFMLSGQQIQMAPKSLFLENPYPNIYYGEDRCLWTSLAAIGKLIVINHKTMRRRVHLQSKRAKLKKVLASQYSGLICTFSTSPNPFLTLVNYLNQILLVFF